MCSFEQQICRSCKGQTSFCAKALIPDHWEKPPSAVSMLFHCSDAVHPWWNDFSRSLAAAGSCISIKRFFIINIYLEHWKQKIEKKKYASSAEGDFGFAYFFSRFPRLFYSLLPALCCRAPCHFVSILSPFFFHVCLLIVALLRRLPPWANDDGKYFARHNRAKMQNVVN